MFAIPGASRERLSGAQSTPWHGCSLRGLDFCGIPPPPLWKCRPVFIRRVRGTFVAGVRSAGGCSAGANGRFQPHYNPTAPWRASNRGAGPWRAVAAGPYNSPPALRSAPAAPVTGGQRPPTTRFQRVQLSRKSLQLSPLSSNCQLPPTSNLRYWRRAPAKLAQPGPT